MQSVKPLISFPTLLNSTSLLWKTGAINVLVFPPNHELLGGWDASSVTNTDMAPATQYMLHPCLLNGQVLGRTELDGPPKFPHIISGAYVNPSSRSFHTHTAWAPSCRHLQRLEIPLSSLTGDNMNICHTGLIWEYKVTPPILHAQENRIPSVD